MTASHPLLELVLWIRWGLAAALLVWAPGHLLVGRHQRTADPVSRLVCSVAIGLTLCVLAGVLAGWFALPVRPWPYLLLAVIASLLVGRSRRWREGVATLGSHRPPPVRAAWTATAAAVVVSAVLLIAGYGSLVAPPHLHDASNHAFIVQRIAESGRTAAGAMFAELPAAPARGYLPGWHVPAALIARLGGVAPYVSAWFLPIVLAALLPAALALAWRSWGATAGACGLGALLSTGSPLVPGGILEWGGFGQIAGLFLLPVLLAALRGLALRPGLPAMILAGCLWAALARVHAAEAFVAVAFLPLISSGRQRPVPDEPPSGDEASAGGRRSAVAILGAASLAAVLVGFDGWALSRDYAGFITSGDLPPPERFGYSLEKFWKAGGRAPGLLALTTLGLIWALARRRWRAPALAAIVIGAVFVGLASVRNPVTSLIGIPFYRQAPRVLYLTVLILPVLSALLLLAARTWFERRSRRPWPDIALALVITVALVPAWPDVVAGHRGNGVSVPFGTQEYALASRLPAILAPGSLVANYWDDGSTWAMHVSGRRFLDPVAWELRTPDGASLDDRLLALVDRPWPEGARWLQTLGVDHVWVSDRRCPSGRAPAPTRANFAADDRFFPLASGGEATLYRICWDAE